MLHDLGWQSLDGRRQDQLLVFFYKIINGLASVETEDILTPADSRTRKNHSFKFKHLQANCDSYNNNNNNNNNNRVYTPLSEKCSQSRVFISQRHKNHIIQYYAY